MKTIAVLRLQKKEYAAYKLVLAGKEKIYLKSNDVHTLLSQSKDRKKLSTLRAIKSFHNLKRDWTFSHILPPIPYKFFEFLEIQRAFSIEIS